MPCSFTTSAAVQELGWGDVLVAAQHATQPVEDDTHGPECQQVSRNVYSLLAQKTRGKTQTLVYSASVADKVSDAIRCATALGWAPRQAEGC